MAKMSKPLIQIDDEVREMTNAELAQYQSVLDEETAKQAELAAKETAKAALLERLGITAEEAALLLG
jgi:hypothetical protein